MREEFNKLVNEAKYRLRKNQRGVAELLGISEQALTDLLKGRRKDETVRDYANKLSAIIEQSVETTEKIGIPYYETENFECGSPSGFGGAIEKSNPDGYFQFPWVKNDGSVFCVRAHGNSMLNFDDPVHSINHGAMVALKRSQVGVIQWGEVYALATADGYIIKQLQPSEKEGCVRCVSFNGATYKPFDIPVSEIYDYALVVGVANINVW